MVQTRCGRGTEVTDFDDQLPTHFSRRFLDHEMRSALSVAQAFCRLHGIGSDYSRASLVAFESHLPQSPDDYARLVSNFKKFEYDGSYLSDWLVALGPGAFFGEVIRKNLGGRWKYPSRLRVFFSFYGGYVSPIFLNWFIIVDKQKIPVFEIARRRLTKGAKEVSMVQIYDEVANGTYRHEKSPL